jgi:hypothetical protein
MLLDNVMIFLTSLYVFFVLAFDDTLLNHEGR